MKKFITVLVAILMNSMILIGQTISSSVQNSFSNSTGFIQNHGQINNSGQNCEQIEYYLSSQDMDVFFSKDKISYVFKNSNMQYYRIDQILHNPAKEINILPKEKSYTRYNYYTSESPDGITGIHSYKKLIYQNVYENIDLIFYFKENKLKYDFVVHPYADFKKIQFSYDGYSAIDINEHSINIQSPLGNFTDRLPLIYTENSSGTNILSGNFTAQNNIIGFNINDYDRSKTLIIDPEIQWSSYLGASSGDEVRSVTVDTDNNIIVVGNSSSSNYPTTSGAIQTSPRGGYDWTVSKFTSDGNLIWSTLIGSSSRDASFQADLGPDNSIWICGDMTSYGFPVTNDAFQKSFGGGTGDAGFAGLSKDGKLLYATYYGGSSYDAFGDINVDSKGNIWLTGRTMSGNFPVTSDAIDNGKSGSYDAILVKFNSDYQREYATFWGGSHDEFAEGIAIDNEDNIIISGYSYSTDYPASTGAYQKNKNDVYDAFIAKFRNNGTLVWSTLFGGNNQDYGSNIAADHENNIILFGYTASTDLNTDNKSFQKNNAGKVDAFCAKFSPDGDFKWSTYIGGTGNEGTMTINDQQGAVTADRYGNIAVCAYTGSKDFPTTADAIQKSNAGALDAFVTVFDKEGKEKWSTYYGGTKDDYAKDVCFDIENNLIFAGMTASNNLYTTANAYQKNWASGNDGFIVKLSPIDCVVKIPSINSAKQEYCYGDYITLNTQGYFSDYKWYENDVLINGANDSVIYIAGTKTPGEYTYYVEAISCDSLVESEEFVITIFPEVSTGLSEDTTICEGDMIELEATDGYTSYLWSNGSTDSFIFVKNAGTYWVEIEDSHGCIGRDSITVDVSPLPDIEIHIGSEPPYYSGETVVLSAVPFVSAYTHEWSTGSSDSVIYVTESGKYTLLVTNEFGCQNSYSVDLEFVDTCDETSFVYADFSNPKNLKLVGQASHQQNFIRLTPSRINSTGAMWYHRPLPVLNGFTTEFRFRMSDGIAGSNDEASLPGADGIVFIIQNSANNIIGGDGGRIGYSGLNNALAIEFDLYANDSKQIVNFNDPNGNHVALMKSVDNIISAGHTESNTLAINDSIIEIKSDKTEYYAKIDYNIVSKTLRVYLSESDYYGQPVINYYPIELDQVLNLNEGEWAYMGFTSATGESYQIHDIMSWYVCPQPTESILSVEDDAERVQLNCFDISGSRQLAFHLESPGNPVIRIFDLLGREVFTDTMSDLPAGNNIYLMPDYLSGVYFYHIIHNDKLISGKILL